MIHSKDRNHNYERFIGGFIGAFDEIYDFAVKVASL